MSITIGVDPGLDGAIALVDSYGELVTVHDIPTTTGATKAQTKRRHVSAQLLHTLFLEHGGIDDETYGTVVIEDVTSTPQMGVTGAFSFGRSKGIVEGFFAAHELPIVYAVPRTWKKDMGLTADKELSRQRALERWPRRSELFKLKKHEARAEAALLALWRIERGNRQ